MASLTRARVLTWALAGAALSCGDALVDEAYSGTPRFIVEGMVVGGSEYVNEEAPIVSIAVFWSPKGPMESAEATLLEQPGSAHRAEYYRDFHLPLFDEPGAEHLTRTPSGTRYGIARLGAYQDANENGRRDPEEPLLGASHQRALLHVPTALTAVESPTQAPIPAGWHIVSTPLSCGEPTPGGPPPVPDGDCGVPLGATCKHDGECGGGVCVHDFIGPWPGGACLIPEPPPNGCRQRGSVLLHPEAEPKAYWIPACSASADCERPLPFQCDLQVRGCMPSALMPVELTDDGPQPTFCPMPSPPP